MPLHNDYLSINMLGVHIQHYALSFILLRFQETFKAIVSLQKCIALSYLCNQQKFLILNIMISKLTFRLYGIQSASQIRLTLLRYRKPHTKECT